LFFIGGKRLEQSKRNTLIVIGLGILLVITIIISFRLGRYPIPAKEVLGILLSKIYPIELFWTDQVEMVLINIRLPRIILACLVGCCLSAAGAAYQGVFQNPLLSKREVQQFPTTPYRQHTTAYPKFRCECSECLSSTESGFPAKPLFPLSLKK
jgi:ABC-type enterobactin transport system permease subunit